MLQVVWKIYYQPYENYFVMQVKNIKKLLLKNIFVGALKNEEPLNGSVLSASHDQTLVAWKIFHAKLVIPRQHFQQLNLKHKI